MNALKTGIDCKSEVMRCERPEDYDQLIAAFQSRFLPATPEEQSFVDALIRHEWLSRRYMCVETGMWNRRLTDESSLSLGQVFLQESQDFSRAGQLFNAARRAFAATLKQLRETQALRAREPRVEADPALPVTEPHNQELDSFLESPAAPVIPVTAPAALLSRDCEGALPEIPNPAAETKPHNPELDSFLTFSNPPQPESPAAPESAQDDPPAVA